MDSSNPNMIKMLTQQISTVFNPMIQNTNYSYQLLTHQMDWIVDLFGAPQTLIQPFPNNKVKQQVIPQSVKQHILKVIEINLGRNILDMVLVNRNQDKD